MSTRKPYPSDVTDDEWAFVAPYLTLMRENAPQRDYPLREHSMRETFNGLRWMARAGAPWRLIANDLPPWRVVYEQTHRWIAAGCFEAGCFEAGCFEAGCFEAIVHDLRELLRVAGGRKAQSTAAIFDGRTMQSTPESGSRAGYDGAKKKNGSKVHIAVDTLGHLLAVLVTPANEQERAQVAQVADRFHLLKKGAYQNCEGGEDRGVISVLFVESGGILSPRCRRHARGSKPRGSKPGRSRSGNPAARRREAAPQTAARCIDAR